MLILMRNPGQVVWIGNDTTIKVNDISRGAAELTIESPTLSERREYRLHSTVWITDEISVMIVDAGGNRVRLGITAPKSVNVVREEIIGPSDSRYGFRKCTFS